jgi:hypothetical protein
MILRRGPGTRMHKGYGKRRPFRGIRILVGAASIDEEDSVCVRYFPHSLGEPLVLACFCCESPLVFPPFFKG